MKIFYGAAIQGEQERGRRAYVHQTILDTIKETGHRVVAEHTRGKSTEEGAELLEQAFGPLPPVGNERTVYVRRKLIEAVEGGIDAAIFEVSVPSTGTGNELTHAYLRPRLGLPRIPILALYEQDFWPSNLSTMIRGISSEEVPNFQLRVYQKIEQAKQVVQEFLEVHARTSDHTWW